MPRSWSRRFGGRFGSGFPSERDWENSTLLTPQPGGYDPELVSDGGGLPFSPSVFDSPGGRLDEDDPAVQALVAMLARQKAPVGGAPPTGLSGWRLLARTEQEVLFGHGLPPALLTVVMRREGRRQGWMSHTVTKEATLRSVRDGVRASGWRPDPKREPEPGDTFLRVLITEQTRAGGKRADDRLLAPDLHVAPDELVLTTYVTPRDGFQMAAANPETPARILLPEPLGDRDVIDGAVFDPSFIDDP
jgi:hypothetical protein